jgi:hypothetical protein
VAYKLFLVEEIAGSVVGTSVVRLDKRFDKYFAGEQAVMERVHAFQTYVPESRERRLTIGCSVARGLIPSVWFRKFAASGGSGGRRKQRSRRVRILDWQGQLGMGLGTHLYGKAPNNRDSHCHQGPPRNELESASQGVQ